MKTIFILVDALKSKYVCENDMPFLYEFIKNNYTIGEINPSPGFCERSEIFTGLNSFDSGNFTAIARDPKISEYKGYKFLAFLKCIFSFNKRVQNFIIRKYLIWKGINMKPYYIPLKSLNKYYLTEDGNTKRIKYKTIFNILDENNLSYCLDAFTTLAGYDIVKIDSYTEYLKKRISYNDYFIPIYLGSIDYYGHHYKSNSLELKNELRKIDKTLKEMYKIAIKNNYQFSVLGDHGMFEVRESINIKDIISKLKLKEGKQYDMFLDSTVARFWFYDEESRIKITNTLEKIKDKGKVINEKNYKKYNLPMDIISSDGHPIYGDTLWYANSGVIIFPDYFNDKIDIGMHGYLDKISADGKGIFTANSTIKKGYIIEKELNSICDELCELLEINHPNEKWRRDIDEY